MSYPAPAPYAQPRKSNAWKWVLGILGFCVLLCGGGLVACTTIFATAANEVGEQIEAAESSAAASSAAAAAANSASCAGKTYADQQPANDRCADSAGAVVIGQVSVTATALAKGAQGTLCTTVSYRNDSGATVSFNTFDWKLQIPAGEVLDAFDTAYTGDDRLGSGDLVTGGSKSGKMCFTTPAKGQHVLIYKPSFWNSDRGIWITTF